MTFTDKTRPAEATRRPVWLGWLVHAVAAALILLGAWVVAQARDKSHAVELHAMYSEMAHDIARGIEREVTKAKILSDALAAALAINPELSQAEYEMLASRLTEGRPEVRNLAAVPGMVARYVYPREGNEAVLGHDLRGRPDQMRDVRRAVQLGIATWGGPYDLVQGGRGFIVRSPVYVRLSPSGKGRRLWGVTGVVLDHDRFFYLALNGRVPEGAEYLIADADGNAVIGSQTLGERDPVITSLQSEDVDWTVLAAPEGGWPAHAPETPMIWLGALALVAAASAVIGFMQRENARRLSAQRLLGEAVEALDDGFVVYDCDDRLILCNSMCRDLYAASAELIRPGARFEDILRFGLEHGQFPEAEGREEEWLAERLRAHREAAGPIHQQTPDGRWLRVVERRTPSGNTVGLRVDVTELKLALERAEEANRIKTDFLNTVSHELRTPLGVMLGYDAFLMHPRKLPSHGPLQDAIEAGRPAEIASALAGFEAEIARFARLIDRSGQHLLSLIMSILDYAALAEGRIILDLRPLPLGPFLEEIAETLADSAARKGLSIEVEAEDVAARADPRRLRQILINLVGNAIKFTDEGRITLRASEAGGRVRIEVADTGRGIPAAEQKRIFERFTQLDATATRESGGIGLGLSICHDLVALHGGEISLQSTPGKGSTFTVTLQEAETQDEARQAG